MAVRHPAVACQMPQMLSDMMKRSTSSRGLDSANLIESNASRASQMTHSPRHHCLEESTHLAQYLLVEWKSKQWVSCPGQEALGVRAQCTADPDPQLVAESVSAEAAGLSTQLREGWLLSGACCVQDRLAGVQLVPGVLPGSSMLQQLPT